MNETIKLSLPVSILLSAVVLGGVYFITTNQQRSQGSNTSTQATSSPITNADSVSQAQCEAEGKKFFQTFRSTANTGAETTWRPPEYHFNTRLQTCLMAWQNDSIVAGIDLKTGAVIDIYSNKEILGDSNTHGGWEEYVAQKDTLMAE